MGWLTKRLGYGIYGTVDGDVPDSPPQVSIDQTGTNNRVAIVVDFLISTDTYTGVMTGVSHTNTVPHRSFAIQVTGTNGVANAWDVVIEGSIDGTNFTPILHHTQNIGDSQILWSNTNQYASITYRTRVVSLTLGPATNIVVTILATT